MESLLALLFLFVLLALVGVPLAVSVSIAFIVAVLILALWVGVALLKIFLYLIPTSIVGILTARIAMRLGMPQRKAENVGLAATLPCLYYFFFS